MSFNFENVGAYVSGADSVGQNFYADSISISEQISEISFSAMGTNNSNTFAASAPEGSIDMSFYITGQSDMTQITGQYGGTGFTTVRAGPFTAEKALLNSFSLSAGPEDFVMGSISYTYCGQISSGASPSTPSNVTLIPAHGAATTVSFEDAGVENGILGFSYSFSQSFEVDYSIGSEEPSRVTFTEGSIDLDIEGQMQDWNFEKTDLTGTSGLCPQTPGEDGFTPRTCEVAVKNLCGETIVTLPFNGYLNSRSFDVSPNENVRQSISLSQAFVPTGEECGS